MSWTKRKHQLRDAVAAALPNQVSGLPPCYPVVSPFYKPEDLWPDEGEYTGPQVPVWLAGVSAAAIQGPDWNTVSIGVGVVGLTFDAEGYSLTDQAQRVQELTVADQLDDILSEVLGLFTPKLDPALNILEDFRFQEVTQPLQLDVALYRENGVWLSAIFLTYLDQLDDESAV